MVKIGDTIQLLLTKQEVFDCIRKTQSVNFLDNLRHRHPNVQFDCKLRGYVGELAIKKWFLKNGIQIEATDYLPDGDSIDIDFIVAGTNIELKTSLIPDRDDGLEDVIAKRDIKLIRRNGQSIEDLKGDIHMQIYFQQKAKERDNWLSMRDVDLGSSDVEYIYRSLRADYYLTTTYFVAWIDKTTLVKRINALPVRERCWSFAGSMRQFWTCPLRDSKKPAELIRYFNRLIVGAPAILSAKNNETTSGGHCIRCGVSINYTFGEGKPIFYCKDCWREWYKEGHNSEQLENYCHRCGRKYRTKFSKPLCWPDCWKEVNK